MKTILLVEDEKSIRESLTEFLCKEQFKVECAVDLNAAAKGMNQGIDLVILDWMLPDGQGIELIRRWRSEGTKVPVILLTARNELLDKVLGLEIGADDYVTKPFEPRELLARVHVQLRKQIPAVIEERLMLRGNEIEISLRQREVRFGGDTVELTKMEFDLLKLLVERPDQVFSREEILNQVWGFEHYPTTRTVDTHILQLRQKFEPEYFETVRGIGYRFRSSAKADKQFASSSHSDDNSSNQKADSGFSQKNF
jgi:DNA-binding response OmpR family regulator